MSAQYVAAVVSPPERSGRRAEPVLTLCRFDIDSVDEPVSTGNLHGVDTVSPSAARRILAGRTVLVADRVQADEVQQFGAIMGDLDVVDLSELAETVRLVLDPARQGQHALDTIQRLVDGFAQVRDQVQRYDTPTLTRIAGYANIAGWSSRGLFAEALEMRAAQPLMLRQDHLLGSHEMMFLGNRDRPDPLRRTGVDLPLDADRVAATLAPGGGFSRVLSRFESRRPQQQMAEAVTRTLNEDGWLLVEAGTGTGKSIAYLTPAARFAVERSERVVVSTNTKALQDQLVTKDVPDLQHALAAEGIDETPRAAVLKGRSNYVCLRRWFAHDKSPLVNGPADAGMRGKVHLWLPVTETGDRSELRLAPEEDAEFSRVSAEGEACNAATCVFQQRNQCFLYRARRVADSAHIVVVNHALLLSDSGERGGGILPEYERLIIDEAHHLEDQATSQFGATLTELAIPEMVDACVRLDSAIVTGLLTDATTHLARTALDPRDQERAAVAREKLQAAQLLGNRLRSVSIEFFSAVRALADSAGTEDMGYGRSLRLTDAVRRTPAWTHVEIQFDGLNAQLRDFEELVRWYLGAVHEVKPEEEGEDGAANPAEDLEIELANVVEHGMEISAALAEMVLAPSVDRVYWVSISAGVGRLSLNAAPLHVGQYLRAGLLERMRSVVMTSATLTTDRGFDYLKDRLSCEEADELTLDSPFDYRKSALLYLCDDIPEPNQPGYQQVLERTLVELGTALDGRTLVLFTSHTAMRSVHRALKQPMAARGVNVLAQRADGSPRQLIEQFKADSRTMLLGTSTFWEGVDVVGPALSALVIAKLPFAVPTDPVIAARSEQFDNPFQQYSVPQAVLKFKQGFGRLIRSSTDRGICVVLDRRTISKRYGTSFVQSLPTCTVRVDSASRAAEAALNWLGDGLGPARGEER